MQKEVVRVIKRKNKPTGSFESDPEDKSFSKKSKPASFSLADQIAGDQFHYKNLFVKQLKDSFPDSSRMWHVDKMFPYTNGGMLFVDEPKTAEEIDLCALKKVVMKNNKFKYIAIDPQMDYLDCMNALED